MGDLILPPPVVGIAKLSELEIDVNKDWLGYIIKNLGAPVDPNDAVRLPVKRNNLEYVTVDVTFQYLQAINKIDFIGRIFGDVRFPIVGTIDEFADKALEALRGDYSWIHGRFVDDNNFYGIVFFTPAATEDLLLRKAIAGTYVTLGTEAVDLGVNDIYNFKFSCSGTTLEAYREDMVTPKISATDTDLASGKWGLLLRNDKPENPLYHVWLRAPSSPSPQPVAYFDVPLVGTGTLENPFRPQLPYEEFTDPVLGKRNLLTLSHSSLIPVDRATGNPLHGTALVRIFEQPDRDPTLRDIPTCLDALRAMPGVVELTRDDALRRARALDDKLHLFDLVRVPKPTKDQMKEYIEWRKSVHKVEMKEEPARRYLESDKGWGI